MAEKGVDIKVVQRHAVNGFAFCHWLKQKSPLFAIPYMTFSDIAESKHWYVKKHNIVEHMFYFSSFFSTIFKHCCSFQAIGEGFFCLSSIETGLFQAETNPVAVV